MLLDMCFYRNEILVNEAGGFLVFIRFGIQPNTPASRRRRAKVEQNGMVLFLRYTQCLVYIFVPFDAHTRLLQQL